MSLFRSVPDFDLSTPRDGKHIAKTRDIAFIALLVFKNASSRIGLKETWADGHFSYSIDGTDGSQIPPKALTAWLGRRYWGFRRAFNHSGITPKGYEYVLEGMVRSPRTMMGQTIETFGKSLSWSFTSQGDALGGQTIATNLYRWVGSSSRRSISSSSRFVLSGMDISLLGACSFAVITEDITEESRHRSDDSPLRQ